MPKAADEVELDQFEEDAGQEEEALLGDKPVISQKRKKPGLAARLVLLGIIFISSIFISYVATAYIFPVALLPDTLRQARNILFVVAHPDDECLFFTPAVTSLLRPSAVKSRGHLLVMSAGNNYGLGEIRRQELKGSCDALGLTSCLSLDTQQIQDNPKYWWPDEELLTLIKPQAEEWNIDAIVTFDHGGVSNHINHRAVSAAVKKWVHDNTTASPPAYSLLTVPIMRKYSGLVDLPFTTLPYIWRSIFNRRAIDDHGLLVSPASTYLTTWRAFGNHKTQFTWDRYLYLVFSRYCYVNQLEKL